MPLYHISEVGHEWLGVALAVILIAHLFLQKNWLKAIRSGTFSTQSKLRLAIAVPLLLLLVMLIGSGIVISGHIFAYQVPDSAVGFARRAHLASSHALFLMAGLHAGIHYKPLLRRASARIAAKSRCAVWAFRLACAGIVCVGAWQFVALRFGEYLLLSTRFGFSPANVPYAVVALEFAAVFALFLCIGYRISLMPKSRHASDTQRNHLPAARSSFYPAQNNNRRKEELL